MGRPFNLPKGRIQVQRSTVRKSDGLPCQYGGHFLGRTQARVCRAAEKPLDLGFHARGGVALVDLFEDADAFDDVIKSICDGKSSAGM